jgi:hypothetical protein
METRLETITNLNDSENTAKIASTQNHRPNAFAGACLMFAGVTQVLAQEKERAHEREQDCGHSVQIVALDECDPKMV